MSPRKYDMSKRAAAVAQTRQRIVDATRELHSQQGIAATSWDDIAARAGVGVGTVYRHFPSLDELIPACGEITMQVVALPDRGKLRTLFEGATEPAERIERLVREVFAIYERGAPQLRAIRREADVHPRVAQDRDQLDASLNALVDTALEPLDATGQDRALARALVDLNTWEVLRDQGLGPAESVATISDVLATRLTARRAGREHASAGRARSSSGDSPTYRAVTSGEGGPRPGVDITNNAGVRDLMDGE
jgi:AcrR family transcriptional regulator